MPLQTVIHNGSLVNTKTKTTGTMTETTTTTTTTEDPPTFSECRASDSFVWCKVVGTVTKAITRRRQRRDDDGHDNDLDRTYFTMTEDEDSYSYDKNPFNTTEATTTRRPRPRQRRRRRRCIACVSRAAWSEGFLSRGATKVIRDGYCTSGVEVSASTAHAAP